MEVSTNGYLRKNIILDFGICSNWVHIVFDRVDLRTSRIVFSRISFDHYDFVNSDLNYLCFRCFRRV